MRRIGILLACGSLTLAFGGCDSSSTTDGGMIMLMDSGGRVDAGARDGGGTDPCPPQVAPAPSMTMVCQASTLTCLMTAGTAAAQQACIDADANAMACDTCINAEVWNSCTAATTNGCGDQFGELTCCLIEECPGGLTEACAATAVGTMAAPGPCAGDANTFFTCLNTAQGAMACGVSQLCFMPPGGTDAGPPVDAGPAPDAGP